MGLVSKKCVDFVKEFEGFYPNVYLDCVGVKTLGYGMTGKEIEGIKSVTETQASKMLEDLLNNNYAMPIKKDLDKKNTRLKQNEFDALVSMAYNVGVGGVLGSTLYKNICNGIRDKDTITSNFQMWCKGGGKRIEGLYRRRTEEAKMFLGKEPNVSNIDGKTGICMGDGVRIRSTKDTNKKNILGQLNKGDKVKLYRKEGNWYHIYYPQHGGFVSAEYIKEM